MAYADYEYYNNVYRGVGIAPAEFDALAERASEYIDQYSFGRAAKLLALGEYVDEIKRACCAVAETVQSNRARGGIAAETTGKQSVTYADAGADGDNKRIAETIKRTLWRTGMLYAPVAIC